MKKFCGSFLGLLLVGCSGPSASNAVGSQSGGVHNGSTYGAAIQSAYMAPDHKGGNNYRNIRLHGKGGTIEFKPFKSYTVDLPYAPNSLGKNGHVVAGMGHYDGWMGGAWPNAAPDFSIDWEGALGLNESITFNSDDLKFTISGVGLMPRTFYTLFVYTSLPSGGWSLVSQTALGRPVKYTLSTPSVLENGFTAPQGDTVLALEH